MKSRYQSVFEWIEIFDNNTSKDYFHNILIAGINMITTFSLNFRKKTRLIGILKALGCNNWSIEKYLFTMLCLVFRLDHWKCNWDIDPYCSAKISIA